MVTTIGIMPTLLSLESFRSQGHFDFIVENSVMQVTDEYGTIVHQETNNSFTFSPADQSIETTAIGTIAVEPDFVIWYDLNNEAEPTATQVYLRQSGDWEYFGEDILSFFMNDLADAGCSKEIADELPALFGISSGVISPLEIISRQKVDVPEHDCPESDDDPLSALRKFSEEHIGEARDVSLFIIGHKGPDGEKQRSLLSRCIPLEKQLFVYEYHGRID